LERKLVRSLVPSSVSRLLRTWAKDSRTPRVATGRKEDAGVERSGAVHGNVEVAVVMAVVSAAVVNGR